MNEILLPRDIEIWPRAETLKRLLWTAAGACALGGLYAWRFGDHWVRVERHDMPLPNLAPELEGATIAHISDLHCSPIVVERYLRQCVELVNSLEVDFVAITGDFITGPKHYARRIARVLSKLAPKIATVACLGNHDYGIFHPNGLGRIRGLHRYVADRLSHADIFVMMNESRTFNRGRAHLQFVGVEDYWAPGYNPHLAFEMARDRLPTIGLCHNPDAAFIMAQLGAHWTLSGHTHGRLSRDTKIRDIVFPINYKRFAAGRYQLADGKNLYVNRGLGYALRVRLNARPEITLFTLRQEQPAQDGLC